MGALHLPGTPLGWETGPLATKTQPKQAISHKSEVTTGRSAAKREQSPHKFIKLCQNFKSSYNTPSMFSDILKLLYCHINYLNLL